VEVLSGPVLVLTALLALAGVFKLHRPAPTAGALRAMHLPGRPALVRVLGAVEVVVGGLALVTGAQVWLTLAAAAYLAFAAFVAAALLSGSALQSCGCFGQRDTPPSVVHLVVNLTAAVVLLVAAAGQLPSPADVLADQPWHALPFMVLVLISLELSYLVLTALPAVLTPAQPEISSRR
jgi:Methylamine utilisation protein MauE